ncbi:hypothetical protein Q0M94_15785 [Deinococcus radiomollis]|uniref:hypothetical protein n=1 Tax=Deinococcus radiomollis TaxID=468916 RepID=UPI00389121CB
MNRASFLLSCLVPISCAVLASCAPTLIVGVGGRIVNVRTGQEGQITFLGGFRDRASLPTDPDNVTVALGNLTYSGRYTVLGRNGALGELGLSLNVGTGFSGTADSIFGNSGFYGSYRPFASDQALTRPGNLIARATTPDGSTATLTCTFQTDRSLHGIGSCQDSAGGSYSLQF